MVPVRTITGTGPSQSLNLNAVRRPGTPKEVLLTDWRNKKRSVTMINKIRKVHVQLAEINTVPCIVDLN